MKPADQHARPLHIFYLEDNPLIVFHVAELIEDLGHVFAGSADSFASLQSQYDGLRIDAALIDIDLADGMTGPTAAAWLNERGVPTIFVTGQNTIAAQHRDVSVAILAKPVEMTEFAAKLALLRDNVEDG